MKKLDILVDGFNLALRKGSGIKTYGITLLDAYAELGHQVSVMTDNKHIKGDNEILNDVLYFDQEEIKAKSYFNSKYIDYYKDLSGLFKVRKPNQITPKITVPNSLDYLSKVSGKRYQHLENVADIFHSANRLYGVFRRCNRVKLQQPPDVWHMTAPLPIKVNAKKTVITVHDLIPLKVPFTTLDIKQDFYHLFKWACHSADMILSVSEHTKKDIIDIYQIPEEKIQVSYQSYQTQKTLDDPEFEDIYLTSSHLETKKYVLFVGNIEPKKNIKALISAMAYVNQGYKLVIVGRKAWMHESQLKNLDKLLHPWQYVFLDYVSQMELSILYKNALCLVFPSLYEGFGLPVLEAMAHDCPVICSNAASLPEVGGDAALYVDPYNFQEIRDCLRRIIKDKTLRKEMVSKGRKQVDFFSQENYANRLNQAYEKLFTTP